MTVIPLLRHVESLAVVVVVACVVVIGAVACSQIDPLLFPVPVQARFVHLPSFAELPVTQFTAVSDAGVACQQPKMS